MDINQEGDNLITNEETLLPVEDSHIEITENIEDESINNEVMDLNQEGDNLIINEETLLTVEDSPIEITENIEDESITNEVMDINQEGDNLIINEETLLTVEDSPIEITENIEDESINNEVIDLNQEGDNLIINEETLLPVEDSPIEIMENIEDESITNEVMDINQEGDNLITNEETLLTIEDSPIEITENIEDESITNEVIDLNQEGDNLITNEETLLPVNVLSINVNGNILNIYPSKEDKPISIQETEVITINKEKEKVDSIQNDLLNIIIKEIYTPIEDIFNLKELLLDSDLTETTIELTTKIKKYYDHLSIIFNKLSDFYNPTLNKSKLEKTSLNLRESIESVIDLLSSKSQEKDIKIDYIISPETPTLILGYPEEINQILFNILDNAIKFTHEGYIIISVISEIEEDDIYNIRFSIKDTGIGISPETKGKLFKPFVIIEDSCKHLGLGLTITKHLCNLIGGEIWLESQENCGSTFYFKIKAKETFNK
jgi:signal transduction histidine kinase